MLACAKTLPAIMNLREILLQYKRVEPISDEKAPTEINERKLVTLKGAKRAKKEISNLQRRDCRGENIF